MPNLTTKLDLTSTTIQIRSDDAKSNFMSFDHKWEATSAIRIHAKVTKAEDFDELFLNLPLLEQDYITVACGNIQFGKELKFYLPDWVFLDSRGRTLEESVAMVVIELVTGISPDECQSLFNVEITFVDLEPGVEIGFPVLD